MAKAVLNLFLFLALLASLGLHWILARDRKQPNFEFMPEMVHSPAFSTYEPNPNFVDGKTFQLPEQGTIARGRMPLHFTPSFEDFARAGTELHNPFSSRDAKAQERGAFIFSNYCKMCHGPEGKGDGLLPQRGVPPPPPLQGPRTLQLKDGQMFYILTFGQGNMSSHATQLSRDDRWKVILHIRSLQQQAAGEKRP